MNNQHPLITILFLVCFSLFAGASLYWLLRFTQQGWAAKAERFVKQDKPELQRVMQDSFQEQQRIEEVLADLEAAVRTFDYNTTVLADLIEALALFAPRAPVHEEEFRAFLANIVLAATQALLPTTVDTRARILVYNRDALRQYAAYVGTVGSEFSGRPFPVGHGAVGQCFARREAVIIADAWADPLFADEPRQHKYRSVVCVPIPASAQGQPLGVLNVDAPPVGYFNGEHARLLGTVANLICLAWFTQFRNIEFGGRVMV